MNYKYLFCLLLGLPLFACCQAPASRRDYLTNAGKGKYWDCVYSTDVYGHANASYAASAGPAYYRHATIMYRCDYFASNGQALHYNNVDSVTVIDRGANTDIQYNPDSFTLQDNTLTFGGHWHNILALTPQVMVLEYEYEGRKAISTYLPSKYQKKVIRPVAYQTR
jgi:hypothetical protein